MHVVLLGSTGFVGQAVVKELLTKPWVRSVRVLIRSTMPDAWFHQPQIKLVRGALPDIPRDLFPEKDPFVVIHFASVQRTTDPKELEINRLGLEAIYEHAGSNLRGLVYGSSLSVHGQGAQKGVDSKSPLNPETPLAVSRVQCEQLIKKCSEERNIGYALLRSRFILDALDPSTLMPWIALAKAGILPGTGDQKFSVIERGDYAKVIVNLAESYKKVTGYAIGAFPIGYAMPLHFGETWRSIRVLLGKSPKARLVVKPYPTLLKLLHSHSALDSLAVKLELMAFDHYASIDELRPFVSSELLDQDPQAVVLKLIKASL